MSSIVSDAVALGRSDTAPDERPLTDQERQQVARLLSDPFAFPQTFKAWLIAFLESSDLTLPISSISGLGATLGIGGTGNTGFIKGLLPAGAILGWTSGRVPSGCVRCDGVAYSRTAYSALFKEIGTIYGPGDGVNTFNVPDMRRRIPVGAGTSAFQNIGGSENHPESTRWVDHHHVINLATSAAVAQAQALSDEQKVWAVQAAQVAPGDVMPMAFYDTSGGYDQDHSAYLTIHFIIVT